MQSLPLELWTRIFLYLSPKKAVELSSLKILDPLTKNGQYIWKKYRQRLHFPDPVNILLTDFMFLKAYYTRGCDFCKHHPLTRKINWEFFGKKICKECMSSVTVRDYELDINTHELSLPCIETSGYSRIFGTTEYSIYFKEDILNIHDESYMDERRTVFNNIKTFKKHILLSEKYNRVIEYNHHKKEIDSFIQKEFGPKSFSMVRATNEYEKILNSYYKKPSKKLLRNKILKIISWA